MRIAYDSTNKIYVAYITFNQRDILRKAGWRWSPLLKKWSTEDRNIALQFKAFFDTSAREKEKEWQELIGSKVELSKKLELDEKVDYICPEGQKYDGYQEVAIKYALERKHILIADPPGLGKTVEAIGISNNIKDIKRVLIICEASHKIHWQRMWERWNTHKHMSVGISQTIKEKYKNEEGKTAYRSVPQWSNTPVVIVNYHQIETFEKEIKSLSWDIVIIDESQYITNPEAAITQRILGQLKKVNGKWTWVQKQIPTERFLFLTGTPMLGKPKKLFVFCRVCDPTGLGKNYMDFAYKYCGAFEGSWGFVDTGSSNEEELQEKLRSTFMIRRSKVEALADLPEKRRYPFILPKDGLTKNIKREENAYSNLRNALLEYEKTLGIRVDEEDRSQIVLENLYQEIEDRFGGIENISFKEIVSKYSPDVAEAFEELSSARKELAIAKLPMVTKISQDVIDSGNKLIMFCVHREVAEALRDFWPKCCFVTGKVAANKRQAEVDRFQDDPECSVAVGNIHAMGKGFTMTASQHVDFAELHWVPDHIEQAEDRAWRRGQKNAVTCRQYVVEDTMDMRFVDIIMQKMEINKKVLD